MSAMVSVNSSAAHHVRTMPSLQQSANRQTESLDIAFDITDI
jgi:hypothetical protein